ncbi:MAG: hypothetical protein IPP71_10090 [Bacteroidetes bacterium]|nr:hypothetical protein [Bacteroidota bacterium]
MRKTKQRNIKILKNTSFNERIGRHLQNFFSPEKLNNDTEYIKIGKYKRELAERYSTKGRYQNNLYDIHQNFDSNYPLQFSEYEKVFLSNFVEGNTKTYVVSGPMGSGKSTSINYVFRQIRILPEFDNVIFIGIDFSDGYRDDVSSDINFDRFLVDLFSGINSSSK